MAFKRLNPNVPLTAWLILLATLIISTLTSLWMRDFLVERDQEQLEFAAAQLTEKINERLNAYALVLRAGAGLFAGTTKVNRDDWRQFVDTLSIAKAVKGVQGFGFSLIVRPEELTLHEQRMRQEGFERYAVSPAGDRKLYSAIVFLEPFDARNQRALGYDMFSEPVRKAAMEQARDTGLAALTGKVTLVQETDIDPQPGTLMYVPVYRNGAPLHSHEQRKANLVGWVYSPFRMTDLLEGILGDWGREAGVRRAIGVRIYDQQAADENLLFTNLPDNALSTSGLHRELEFNGHRWVLEFAPLNAEAAPPLLAAWLIGAGVLLLGFLIFALYLTLNRTQRNAERIAGRLTQDLQELATRFETIANRVPGMVYSYQLFPDGRSCFPYASQAIQEVYGLNPEQVRHDGSVVLDLLYPEDSQRVKDSILRSARTLSPWQEEYRVIHPDGSLHWVIGDALPQSMEDGSVIWYGAITRITERKQAELRLKEALVQSSRFRDALDRMNTYVFMKDSNLRYTYANQATLDRIGITREQLLGTRGEQFLDATSMEKIRKLDERVLKGERVTDELEINVRGERGVFLQIETPMFEDETSEHIVGLIGISTDITKAKQQAREIERLAHYDPLTGMPNRALLADRLDQAMAMVDRRSSSLAVVYLDLDGFKSVNDTYGHSAGDQVLITVARRMRKALRKEDTLSRLGGDEFVAVLMDMSPDTDYELHLKRLLNAASEPVLLKENAIRLSASLGVSFYPQPEITGGDQLIRQADQAMYQAKLAGKSRFHLFDTELDRSMRSQHETIENVRQALHDHHLCLHYQPKVNMRTSEVIGAEALLRWQHPERGLLAPGAFIGLVEDTPVMLEIGRWVMDSALSQMDNWLQQGLHMPLSINISAVELRDPDFVNNLRDQLNAWPRVAPSMLELEVLETAALGDLAQISRVLDDCRKLGVSIAIDDFGTGYSSLTYFKRLPAKVVKIDQSFVSGILRDPADLTILDGIVRLADALDRQLIAEGVETHEHAEMLLRIGCDLAQGYGIARPMPAEALRPWCAQWRAPEHWANLKPVSRRALPSLYAGVDHRAWVEHFRSYLQGNEAPINLNSNSCRFSNWLSKQPESMPGMETIESLHTQLHALAIEIDKLNKQDQSEQIPALMNTLDLLSNQLFMKMQKLMESIE